MNFLQRIDAFARPSGQNGNDGNSRQLEDETRESALLAGGWMVFIISVGLLLIYLFTASARAVEDQGWVCGVLMLIGGAAGLAGALLGFLFGIPKVLQNAAVQASTGDANHAASASPTRHVTNTNLEEVSDWLSKMLVGVGLTQLLLAPSALWRASGKLADGLALSGGGQTAISMIIVYFSIVGFLTGYLMTRLYLSNALARADRTLQDIHKDVKETVERLANLDFHLDDLTGLARAFLRTNWVALRSSTGYKIPDTFQRHTAEHEALRTLKNRLLIRVIEGQSIQPGRHIKFTPLALKVEADLSRELASPDNPEDESSARPEGEQDQA